MGLKVYIFKIYLFVKNWLGSENFGNSVYINSVIFYLWIDKELFLCFWLMKGESFEYGIG